MKLHIRNITKEDFMEYRCVARNSLGDSGGSITLYGKLGFEVNSVNTLAKLPRLLWIFYGCQWLPWTISHAEVSRPTPSPTTVVTSLRRKSMRGEADLVVLFFWIFSCCCFLCCCCCSVCYGALRNRAVKSWTPQLNTLETAATSDGTNWKLLRISRKVKENT